MYMVFVKHQCIRTQVKKEVINSNITIPITRFPLTHYCSKCHTLRALGEGSPTRNVFCKNCDQKINHIQFPLIIVCEHGHIYDFPFLIIPINQLSIIRI